MPFTVKFPLSLRDGDSSDSVPVPNTPVTVGGNSWSPDRAANKVTVVWVGAAIGVGVVSVSPPQAANVNAKIPATHHLDGATNFESSKTINLFSRFVKTYLVAGKITILATSLAWPCWMPIPLKFKGLNSV